jgi:hypothetical protein
MASTSGEADASARPTVEQLRQVRARARAAAPRRPARPLSRPPTAARALSRPTGPAWRWRAARSQKHAHGQAARHGRGLP